MSKNAPAGSDVAVAAVKSMLAAANSAYDNFTKVAKQATEIAEANVAAATETAKRPGEDKKSRLSAKPAGTEEARLVEASEEAV